MRKQTAPVIAEVMEEYLGGTKLVRGKKVKEVLRGVEDFAKVFAN